MSYIGMITFGIFEGLPDNEDQKEKSPATNIKRGRAYANIPNILILSMESRCWNFMQILRVLHLNI